MPTTQSKFGTFRKRDGTESKVTVNKESSNEEPESAEPEGYDPVNAHDEDEDGTKAKADLKAFEEWQGKLEYDDDFERADKTDADDTETARIKSEDEEAVREKEDAEDIDGEQDSSQSALEPALKAKEPVKWANDEDDETGPGVSPPKKDSDEPILQPGEVLPTLQPKMPGEEETTSGPGDDPGDKAEEDGFH